MPRSIRLGLILLPLIVGLVVGGWFLYQRGQDHSDQPGGNGGGSGSGTSGKSQGKLVVLVVFDQMRGDYLSRWAEQFGPDGFERIKKNGVWYSNTHLPYACASTGPGHASIATGAPPSVHGIIENDWYDRNAAARVYCCQPIHPTEMVPPIPTGSGKPSRGAATGFSPERLLAETVADRLRTATEGKGRAFSLSIKDRTTTLMGGQKPSGAYCFDTRDGQFHTNTYYRESVHPWVAEFNAARMADRWFGKQWTQFRPDLDYNRLAGPDDATHEGYGYKQKRVFPHSMGEAKEIGQEYYGAVETSPYGNELLFELVKKAIVSEKLGAGETPDLLCVSFSSNDLMGHYWGPDSWEVLDVTLRSDKLVGDLLKFLDETLGADRYTVAITADHGICPIPEQKRYPDKYPGADRKSIRNIYPPLTAALDETYGKLPTGPTRWFDGTDEDWDRIWPWIYLNKPAIQARGLDPDVVADYVAQWVGNRTFMLTAFTRKQIETNTLPMVSPTATKEVKDVLERVKLAYYPARSGEVIGVVKPGVLIINYPEGTNHGTPHSYDTHVPVLVYGAGVPALGKRDSRESSLIVAPTVAWALGIDPPTGAVEKVPAEIRAGK